MTDFEHALLAEDIHDHVSAYSTTFASGSGTLLDQHYEEHAVLVPKPGQTLQGAAARITAHDYLLGFGLPIETRPRHIYVAGDTALLIVDWSITGAARGGHPVALRGTATDVAHRGPDGRWRYVIDNPFGVA